MEFHPVAELFPMMNADELEVLRLDIATNGLREDIWTHEGKIIDGRNRYKACLEIGTVPRFRAWDGQGSLVSFVVSLNLKRRHLTESQRAMVAQKMTNMRRGYNQSQDVLVSQADAAAMMNVSTATVTRAAKVQRQGVPELVEQVESGNLTVVEAARIAALPYTKQKQIIKRGRTAARELLVKAQTRSVKRAFRLGCLNCDPEATADKHTVSALMQRLGRKFPAFAAYFNDVVEELESMDLSNETRDNYDRILEAIKLGYQTKDVIASTTGIAGAKLDNIIALMVDYNMIEPKKEIKKTEAARGATKTIYVLVEAAEAGDDAWFEIEEERDGML